MHIQIQLFFQRPFFQKYTTLILGRLAHSRHSQLKNLFIKIFCRHYAVKMSEAVEENPFAYSTFNDFFIRRLKENARPIGERIMSPADGTISQQGYLEGDTLLQAKGKSYSLVDLLAKSEKLTATFENGAYSLIYLAPHNYHRVHMPLNGRLLQMIYVPGTLFSVSPTTAKHIDRLFAKNERVIAIFETEAGKMAVILVGAMIVGSISTVWAGKITPPRTRREVTTYDYTQQQIILNKGQELGYFSLGSTVILLFEKNKIQWLEGLESNTIQMGQNIAQGKAPS